MPPRYTYWTILLEGKPTAFRARDREDLLPTLRQLQSKHPDAVLMWFARGRLWQSPEEALQADARRASRTRGRGSEWRPGGLHEDPRARFKVPRDEKRRRFAAKWRRGRDDKGQTPGAPSPASRPMRRGRTGSGRAPDRPSGQRDGTRRPFGPRDRGRGRKPGGGRRGGGGQSQ